jgi:Tfp pilus assembly protein PilO
MKNQGEHGTVTELVVGLLVCGAAYFFFVRPLNEEAEATRARAEALVAQGYGAAESATERPTTEELRGCAAELAEAARALHARGRSALSESDMLTSLTSLAAEHALSLDQLQPNVIPAGRRTAAGLKADQTPFDDRQAEYTFTVRGEYGRVASFARDFGERYPNTVIVGLRVSPEQEPGSKGVSAILTTRHWAFDAGPAIRLAEAAQILPE